MAMFMYYSGLVSVGEWLLRGSAVTPVSYIGYKIYTPKRIDKVMDHAAACRRCGFF